MGRSIHRVRKVRPLANEVTATLPSAAYRRTAHVSALLTLFLVFPLLLVGAGVTSKDAGMAYPDWPTSNEHLINPPDWWENDHTRWEHGHRLIGWIVGMSAIATVAGSWGAAGWARRLSVMALGGILLQGVLGGLRVWEVSTALAMVHGIWGQVCFCLVALTALVTSPKWLAIQQSIELRSGRAVPRLALMATAAAVIQLILGAGLRHFSSGYLLVAHVLWAMPVIFVNGWLAMWVIGLGRPFATAGTLAKIMGALTVVQLMLGGLAWLVTMTGLAGTGWMTWVVPSAHVGVGALLLATLVVLSSLLNRMVRMPAPREEHNTMVLGAAP